MEEVQLREDELSQAATTPTATEDTVTEQSGNAETEPSDGLQERAFTLPVKFNKQEYQLSVEEATVYAQKGMKYTALEPTLERLRSLAQTRGQSLAALAGSLCGDDTDLHERLAEEYCLLREECPELDTFDKVPTAVVQRAMDSGMPLLYAYLHYRYGEQQRIDRARAMAAAAKASSAGAQRGETQHTSDPAVEAMVRGIWG